MSFFIEIGIAIWHLFLYAIEFLLLFYAVFAVFALIEHFCPNLLHKKQPCPRCGANELEYNGMVEMLHTYPYPVSGWYECNHCGAELRKSPDGTAWEDATAENDPLTIARKQHQRDLIEERRIERERRSRKSH